VWISPSLGLGEGWWGKWWVKLRVVGCTGVVGGGNSGSFGVVGCTDPKLECGERLWESPDRNGARGEGKFVEGCRGLRFTGRGRNEAGLATHDFCNEEILEKNRINRIASRNDHRDTNTYLLI
jgi:hypothetical protein